MGRIKHTRISETTQAALRELACRPLKEQAKQLGLSLTTVKTYRSALIRAGLLHPAPRPDAVSASDIARIRRLAALGYSHRGIAECVGISPRWVTELAQQHGIYVGKEKRGVWTMTGLEALFDVPDSVVELWRVRGWLHPHTSLPGREGSHGVYLYVDRASLQSFIREERAAWLTYRPEALADEQLRALAIRVRELAGGRWVHSTEVAERAGFNKIATVWKRCSLGWLDGWEWVSIGRSRYLWWPDGAELPPYERKERSDKGRGK